MKKIIHILITLLFTAHIAYAEKGKQAEEMQWLSVTAANKFERSKLVNLGMSVENVIADTSYGYAPPSIIKNIRKAGFTVKAQMPAKDIMRGLDFPTEDGIYRNYNEQLETIDKLANEYPALVKKTSMGKSLEGREMWGLQINSDNMDGKISGKPGFIVMGGHHAREHLSVEMPLKFAEYLVSEYGKNPTITSLVDSREIFIFPNINPDGSEFDIHDGEYEMWRKNRRNNGGSSCAGVDLNRNYSFKWGTGGSSTSPCSDVFMGPTPFSEPETLNVKNFVEAHINIKVLLSFHSYSELILYPWGHTYNSIPNQKDLSTFETMARSMAQWNKYTPQQSSDLYIASGDTTDWAYGQLGIFAFTFELSPQMWGSGGFYPGPNAIESAFNDNLRPLLYLLDLADDPYRAVTAPQTTLFY